MRRDVRPAHLFHSAVEKTLFGPFVVTDGIDPGTQNMALSPFAPTEQVIALEATRKLGYSRLVDGFEKIEDIADFWSWCEGPLQAVVTGGASGDASNYQNKSDRVYLDRHNVLVGSVRLSQVRVNDPSCATKETLAQFSTPCFSEFRNDNVASSSGYFAVNSNEQEFGDHLSTLIDNATRAHVQAATKAFTSQAVPQMKGTIDTLLAGRAKTGVEIQFLTGVFGEYDSSKYFSTDLSYQNFDEVAAMLKRFSWIDRQTRAVVISLNVYSPHYDAFAVVSAILEYTPGGGVTTSKNIKVIRLDSSWKPQDKTREMMELTALMLVAAQIMIMVYKIMQLSIEPPENPYELAKMSRAQQRQLQARRNKQSFGQRCCGRCQKAGSYFTLSLWHVVELLLFFVVGLNVLIRMNYQSMARTFDVRMSATSRYTDLRGLAWWFSMTINMDSLVALLTLFKLFKYFELNPHMSMVWRVFGKAFSAYTTYLFIFFVVLGGFAVLAQSLFGNYSKQYLTMSASYNRLLALMVGHFDFGDLLEANTYIAPFFFFVYGFFGFFIMANFFLAIMNDAYTSVADDVRENGFHWIKTREEILAEAQQIEAITAQKFGKKSDRDTVQNVVK
jgi:hypothetical protein